MDKKNAQPEIPAALHERVKAIAKSRGTLLGRMYQEVIDAGLKVLRGKK